MADLPTNIAGNVYTFNLSAAGRSHIDITVEDIPGVSDVQRPIRLKGVVNVPVSKPSRDHSLLPLAVPDEDEWNLLKDSSFEGGHLLALKFGGPDSPLNIAPMNKGANSASGTWGQLEREIDSHVKAAAITEEVQIGLTLRYNDAIDPRIPSGVSGWIRRVAMLTTVAETQVNILVKPPTDQTHCLTKPLIDLFKDINQAAANTGYKTLESTVSNPNAPLDVVDYKRDPISIGLRTRIRAIHPLLSSYPIHGFRKKKGARVARSQRFLLFFYNRFRNKLGPLKTGLLTAEDEQNLGLIIKEWQAQHDHIKPRSLGGTNKYGNLILTHHRSNNKRGNSSRALPKQKRSRKKTSFFRF